MNPKILYHRGHYEAMTQFNERFDWNTLLLNLGIQESWDLFTKTVHSATDKYIPVSTRASRHNPRNPWVNVEVKNNCKKRRQSWTKFCHINANRYASVEDKLKVHQDWITARNLATQTTNNARTTYESRVIMDTKNNRKSLWSYVKDFHGT